MPTKPIGEVGDDVAQRNGGVGRRWGECSGLPPSRPKTLSEMLGNRPQQRPAETSWKSRFEDADRKRKQLMALAQKGNNDLENLKECYRKLKEQCDGLCKQTKEKDEQIEKLKKASTAMYHEYEKLSNQYNEETGAYQKAMKHASSWYKENQELKRRSMALAQKFMTDSPDTALDLFAEEMKTSSISSQDNEELEDLKKSVKDLSMTVGRLQSELNSARLEEFEAQEAAAALSGELEESVMARKLAEAEAKKAQDEMAALKKALEEASEEAKMEGKRADVALRDRNTMAHQSALLLSQALEEDYEGKVASALMEIENLKKQLEEERIAHERKIKELEEKLEEKDTEARLELVEEQLKEMRSRAEEAERKLATFEQRVKEPECLEYKENETGSDQVPSPTLLPPPPPPLPPTPPPPPPFPSCHSQPIIPPPALFASEKPPNQQATCCGIADTNETADQGGSPSKNKQANATQGAAVLDDIINQIKGGRFTLRNTEKRRLKYIGKAGESEDKPPAVKEMLGILGTLRKRPSLASMRNGAGECSQSNGFN